MGKINKKQKQKEAENLLTAMPLASKRQDKRGYKPLPRFKGGCPGC